MKKLIELIEFYRPHLISAPASKENIIDSLIMYYDLEFLEKYSIIRSQICNGTSETNMNKNLYYYYLIWNFYLLSWDDVVTVLEKDNFFNFTQNGLLPIFYSGEGQFLAINCKNFVSMGYKSSVFICSTNNPDVETIDTYYDSIESLITTNIKCYENGAYVIDVDGNLDIEFDLFNYIHEKNNKRSNYWK